MHTQLNNFGEKGYALMQLDSYIEFTDEPLVVQRPQKTPAGVLSPLELVALHNTLVELLELEATPTATKVAGVLVNVHLPLHSQRNLKQQLLKKELKCFDQGIHIAQTF